MMIELADTDAMQWDNQILIYTINDSKSVYVSAIIVVLDGVCVFVNTGFGLDERVSARTAISYGWSARWPVIIGVAVVI